MIVQYKNIKTLVSDWLTKAYILGSSFGRNYESHLLFTVGSLLLVAGLADIAAAADTTVTIVVQDYHPVPDAVIWNATCNVIEFMNGAFGGLMVTISGIIAIISAAFGAFKAASAMLITGGAAFILGDLVDVFFNLRDCRFDYIDG